MAKLEVPQVKDWAEAARDKLIIEMQRLNDVLRGRAFLTGDAISVADITGGVALDMLGWARMDIPGGLPGRRTLACRPEGTAELVSLMRRDFAANPRHGAMMRLS